MARNGGRIEPTVKIFGLGTDVGKISVWDDKVEISLVVREPEEEETTVTLDPESAPLFRMIANRLDEISKRKEV